MQLLCMGWAENVLCVTDSEKHVRVTDAECRCAADIGIGSLGKKNTTYAVRSSYFLISTCDLIALRTSPHTVIMTSRSAARQHVQLLALLQGPKSMIRPGRPTCRKFLPLPNALICIPTRRSVVTCHLQIQFLVDYAVQCSQQDC